MPETLLVKLQYPLNGTVTAAPFSEAVGCVVEYRLKNGFQKSSQDFLRHPVSHDWNAQWAGLRASRLWDVDAAQWSGLKRSAFEVAHECFQVGVKVRLKHSHADFVYSRRSTISFDSLESLPHQLGGYAPGQ
jgi:hypothetical protein